MNIRSTLLAVVVCCLIPVKTFSQDDWHALPVTAPSPANNPTTTPKVELGKKLFFDPRLSLTGTVSCNSCHNLMAGGEDKGDAKALQESQVQGMKLFKSIGCIECHSGPVFNGWEPDMSDAEFREFPRNLDSSYVTRYNLTRDLGRYSVTKTDSDKHAFKVPTLRNIGMTAPYFHNGSVSKLDEAVRVMAETQLDLKISESETKLLIAFLSSLDGPFPEITMPRLPILTGDTVLAP